MRRAAAIACLQAQRETLEALGVTRLMLFGSVARDEAHALSDVDIVVDTADGRAPGLFALARVANALEATLARTVTVISRRGLDQTTRLKRRVTPDLVVVF